VTNCHKFVSHFRAPVRFGRDSAVCTATCYGLDGARTEFRWCRDFLRPPWDPPSPLYDVYRVSFPGVKWPGGGVDRPPHSYQALRLKKKYSYTSAPPLDFTFTFIPGETVTSISKDSLQLDSRICGLLCDTVSVWITCCQC
jgi:hypothetical protein